MQTGSQALAEQFLKGWQWAFAKWRSSNFADFKSILNYEITVALFTQALLLESKGDKRLVSGCKLYQVRLIKNRKLKLLRPED
jgi:hypothetical protein